MSNEELTQLMFPIGTFKSPVIIDEDTLLNWRTIIAQFPYEVRIITDDLSEEKKKMAISS